MHDMHLPLQEIYEGLLGLGKYTSQSSEINLIIIGVIVTLKERNNKMHTISI